jgi:hypothetical protein
MTKTVYCVGITNLFKMNNRIYGNLSYDIDKVINIGDFLHHINAICVKLKLNFIILKSNNKKRGMHIVCPYVFSLRKLKLLDGMIRTFLKCVGYPVDNISLEDGVKSYYKDISGNKHLLGTVLRIGKKNGKKPAVYTVILSGYNNFHKIDANLLLIYKKLGLSLCETILLQRNSELIFSKRGLNTYKTVVR